VAVGGKNGKIGVPAVGRVLILDANFEIALKSTSLKYCVHAYVHSQRRFHF
jgi:hypothetical protein